MTKLFSNPWFALIFVVLSTAFGFGCWALYENATHAGRPDYCYIDTDRFTHMQLRAHRPWAIDATILQLERPEKDGAASLQVLIDAARQINCPLTPVTAAAVSSMVTP